MKRELLCLMAVMVLCLGTCGCGGSGGSDGGNDGPWVGNWVQTNWLDIDDNGVWGADDPSGLGFVAEITEDYWRMTDGNGAGDSYTATYTVGSDYKYRMRYTYQGHTETETGRLAFSADGNTMTQWFDLGPGDGIAAFRWQRED